VHESLSLMYDVVGAVDDDRYVLDMWYEIPGLIVVEMPKKKGKKP
jgi:hypothetical protein